MRAWALYMKYIYTYIVHISKHSLQSHTATTTTSWRPQQQKASSSNKNHMDDFVKFERRQRCLHHSLTPHPPTPLPAAPFRFAQLTSFTWPLCTLNLNSIDFFYDGKRASSATPKSKKNSWGKKTEIKQGEKNRKTCQGNRSRISSKGVTTWPFLLEHWIKPWMELRPWLFAICLETLTAISLPFAVAIVVAAAVAATQQQGTEINIF